MIINQELGQSDLVYWVYRSCAVSWESLPSTHQKLCSWPITNMGCW